jgi:signal transduction histidine kinase
MRRVDYFVGANRELIRAVLVCTALLLLTSAGAFAADAKRVLVLHAFGHAYSPWSDMAGSFRAELITKAPAPIDLYEVSLDTERVRGAENEKPFVDYIHALLGGRKPDLLVPVGAPAVFFVERHRAELFPGTPMLIIGADRRRIVDGSLMADDAAVLLDLDLAAYIENILRLRPEVKNIAVVVGNSNVERYWTSELSKDFGQFSDRVNFTWFNDLPFSEILARAATMPPQSAIFHFLLSEDAKGIPYTQDRALEALREVASVPLFGMGDYEMGRGIVGGPLMQTNILGQQGALTALRMLNGEKPKDIETSAVVFGAPIYDWRELRRWNISESLLPTGSIVQFREPTAWQHYRWEIMLAAAIILGQSLLIAYVLVQSRRRRAAEAEAAEQRRQVAHLTRVSVLGELSGAIAHEISQPLTAILSNAEAALELLEHKSPDLSEIREAISDIVHEDNRAGDVIERLRGLLKKGEHKSEAVDLNELVKSTITLLHSELIGRNIEVATDLASDLPRSWGDPVQLQQVLLNLFMNAMDAMVSTKDALRRIKVSTRLAKDGAVEVRIRDRGHGIRPEHQAELFKPFYTSKEHGLGLGLSICSTIVQAHRGVLRLFNHPDRGAVAVLSLPTSEQLVAAAE